MHQVHYIKKVYIKILAIRSSYNKNVELEKNFEYHLGKIENALELWRMREKSKSLKTLAISKIAHLALIVSVRVFTIQIAQCNKDKCHLAKEKPKTIQATIRNTYELGDITDTDIFHKVTSLGNMNF